MLHLLFLFISFHFDSPDQTLVCVFSYSNLKICFENLTLWTFYRLDILSKDPFRQEHLGKSNGF